MNVYCIDTSSLIELKIKYPREVFPTLWEKMDELIQSGRIIAPIEVKKEIEKGDDELKNGLGERPDEPNADPWLFAVVLVKIEEEKERKNRRGNRGRSQRFVKKLGLLVLI